MDSGRFVLTDTLGGGDACLKDLRIRRCRGCVKCLTEHPGTCEIADGFTETLKDIMASDELVIVMDSEDGRVPDRVRKAVERLSNILDAYTGCGGNVPLPVGSVNLRRIGFECRGNFADGMESEMTGALKKGPVSDIFFEYH